MIKKDILKKLIEQAEVNCSGEKIEYTINDIKELPSLMAKINTK